MGKRILDIFCGAVIGMATALSLTWLFGRKANKYEGRDAGNQNSAKTTLQPSSPIVVQYITIPEKQEEPPHDNNQTANANSAHGAHVRRPLSTRAEICMAIGTVAACFVSAIGLSIVNQTNRVAGMSANAALETAKATYAQQRAYLGASYAELTSRNIVSVVFKNSGPTPAQNVMVNAEFTYTLADSNEKPIMEASSGEPSQSAIGAGDTFYVDDSLTDEDIAALKQGNLKINVSGTLTYKDIFGKSHITKFSFDSDKEMKAEPHHFLFAPSGNSLD